MPNKRGSCVIHEGRPVRLFTTYGQHWIAWNGSEYLLLPDQHYTPLDEPARHDQGGSLRWPDYDFYDLPETGSLNGPQTAYCYIEQWKSRNQLQLVRSNIRCVLKNLATESVNLLAERPNCDPFYLGELEGACQRMIDLRAQLVDALHWVAVWDNRWLRRAPRVMLPDMAQILKPITVSR